MIRLKIFILALGLLLPLSAHAQAEFKVIGADGVKAYLNGKKQGMVIDTRNPDEYRSGHISGAVNVPAERIKLEAGRLPKNKTVPLIFYCRGAG